MLLLTLEDPKARVGSGGATVNALLVVTEHLSAKAGYEVSLIFIVVLCITQFWKTIILSSVIYFKELSVNGIVRIAWRKSGSNALRVFCLAFMWSH